MAAADRQTCVNSIQGGLAQNDIRAAATIQAVNDHAAATNIRSGADPNLQTVAYFDACRVAKTSDQTELDAATEALRHWRALTAVYQRVYPAAAPRTAGQVSSANSVAAHVVINLLTVASSTTRLNNADSELRFSAVYLNRPAGTKVLEEHFPKERFPPVGTLRTTNLAGMTFAGVQPAGPQWQSVQGRALDPDEQVRVWYRVDGNGLITDVRIM